MKNCHTCVYMTYEHGDVGDPEGYVCERKDFDYDEEAKMIDNMSNPDYLKRYKRCYRESILRAPHGGINDEPN